jgi:hypothetical protein
MSARQESISWASLKSPAQDYKELWREVQEYNRGGKQQQRVQEQQASPAAAATAHAALPPQQLARDAIVRHRRDVTVRQDVVSEGRRVSRCGGDLPV